MSEKAKEIFEECLAIYCDGKEPTTQNFNDAMTAARDVERIERGILI